MACWTLRRDSRASEASLSARAALLNSTADGASTLIASAIEDGLRQWIIKKLAESVAELNV
jgi:hypothetical protein